MYRLDEKRKELLHFIEEASDQEASVKPEETRWSILEVLEHLYLMEQMIIYQINQTLKQEDKQKAIEKPIHRATNREYKVEAPESVRPNSEFQILHDAAEGLKKTCEATLLHIHNKDEETLKKRVFPHPSFGDMDLKQWIEFIGWHELRHLDQLKEVKASLQSGNNVLLKHKPPEPLRLRGLGHLLFFKICRFHFFSIFSSIAKSPACPCGYKHHY
ncbi:DinB superfamily protein [Halobacillus karajensis]|uniref:DinB superfamily protein n=1 Tax=Halobacillus karajensis TaxID=195088 RepID=A0A024P5F7_9BACI|nr:DinB family protein [Halobacillus karajensis]CDQ20518.1 DinB superfamily protein [Halobacillus karajensis]CDQ24013.1 DinB superfamily protein [Halobacillus karajensis]CDQ27491.1 DinB superfamily protein [Halobacillus karajensis]SEH90519.1 DinB superfamily protein [Halobacillus karajensis]